MTGWDNISGYNWINNNNRLVNLTLLLKLQLLLLLNPKESESRIDKLILAAHTHTPTQQNVTYFNGYQPNEDKCPLTVKCKFSISGARRRSV